MIINGIIQTKDENQDAELFFSDVIGWCHQCYQRYTFDQDIDLEELKNRLNVSNIDYKQFMVENSEHLEKYGKLYLLRIMHILYPEEYSDPDKE